MEARHAEFSLKHPTAADGPRRAV